MPYYPTTATGLNYITYPVGPTTTGLAPTAHASANTKGAYTQVVASTPFTCNAIIVEVMATTATVGRLFLLDIATGGAGAETVVVPDLLAEGTSSQSGFYGHGGYMIPLGIAAGTRIAVRVQCSTGGDSLDQVAITLIAAGDQPGIATFVTYGANTADSGGTQLDPGGTAHTKGNYAELTASSSAVTQFAGLMVTYGHATVATCGWSIDIATGPALSETVLIPDLRVASATNGGTRPSIQQRFFPLLTYIPAGTRIAARASCSINTATERLIDVALLAGTAP